MTKRSLAFLSCAILSIFSAQVYAREEFETIQQAQQFCPAINSLQSGYSGKIYGYKHISFENESPSFAPTPAKVDQNNIIQDVQFRKEGRFYGWEWADEITCFYSYPSKDGGLVQLVMTGDD